MLGKSFASPVRSFEPSTLYCISNFDIATLPNATGVKLKASHRIRQSVQIDEITGRTCLPVSASGRWKLHSTIETQTVGLDDEERRTWEACKESLTAFSFSTEEQDKILGKAFGHAHSPYWGDERETEIPKKEDVDDKLDYLRSLGLSEEDLGKVLKKFPEVLGCKLDEEMKKNIGILDDTWGIKGKSLKNLLLRNPKVLGYNVDCKGDCIAKCTRCWVRF